MSKSILLVDDNKSVIDITRAVLQRSGFTVYVAYSAREAFDSLDAHCVDLIITDVMMPETDGFQLVKRIKADDRHQNIPIIFLTALDSLEDELEGYMSGGESYLTKPFKARDLLDKVTSVFDGTHIKISRTLPSDDIEIRSARVLALANDERLLAPFRDKLKEEGYEVESAAAAPASLSMLDDRSYDLLVVHVGAQGIRDGDVLRFLDSFRMRLPVVILHDAATPIQEETYRRARAVIRLPVDAAKLVESCREAFLGRSGT